MTDKKTEALKLAQEAIDDRASLTRWKKARDAIREALAEQPAPSSHLTDEQKAANGLAWLARLEAMREKFAGLAEQPAQQQEPSHSDIQLAEQIMSDCGCSTNNQRLLERITERLAKHRPAQQQEPVTWKDEQGNVRMALDAGEIQSSVGYVYSVHGERIKNACIRSDIPNGTPLYTSPPAQRTWIGLTDEEIQTIWRNSEHMTVNQVCRAIEAKLKEKNT